MSAKRAFEKDRERILRLLSEAEFDRFYLKWNLTRPRVWLSNARLAIMHKSRLTLDTFTDAEKQVSRDWLAAHGFTEAVKTDKPCPACGHLGGFSFSNCETCGVGSRQ